MATVGYENMIIIIDGYNVIKQLHGERYIDERQRNRFIHMLSAYGRKKKHRIIVVFDGGSHLWPSQEMIAKLKVIYSGIKETADEVIMNYIDENRTKELLLVSSDNELGHYASKYGVASICSKDFYYLLQEALQSAFDEQGNDVTIEIDLDDEEQDLNALMEKASEVIPHKSEDSPDSQQRQSRLQKMSKNDRALLKKLHKL